MPRFGLTSIQRSNCAACSFLDFDPLALCCIKCISNLFLSIAHTLIFLKFACSAPFYIYVYAVRSTHGIRENHMRAKNTCPTVLVASWLVWSMAGVSINFLLGPKNKFPATEGHSNFETVSEMKDGVCLCPVQGWKFACFCSLTRSLSCKRHCIHYFLLILMSMQGWRIELSPQKLGCYSFAEKTSACRSCERRR